MSDDIPELDPVPWAWTEQEDAEVRHDGGHSRDNAIMAARQAAALDRSITRYWFAPCRRATEQDVAEHSGEGELFLGDWMVDLDNMEELPA